MASGQQEINKGQYYGNFNFGGASLEYGPGYFKSYRPGDSNETGEFKDGDVFFTQGGGRLNPGAMIFKNGVISPVDMDEIPSFWQAKMMAEVGRRGDGISYEEQPKYFALLEQSRKELSQKIGKPVNIIGMTAVQNYHELLGDRQKRTGTTSTTPIKINQLNDFASQPFRDLGMPEKTADQLRAERTQPLPGTPYTGPGAAPASQGGVPFDPTATAGNSTSTAASQPGSYVYKDDVLDKKANDAAVNQLYQSYFGRNATQAELNNWGDTGGADTTVRALEDFLKAERATASAAGKALPAIVPIGGTSTTVTTGGGATGSGNTNTSADSAANITASVGIDALLANSNLQDWEKQVIKQVAGAYNANSLNTDEILAAYNKVKNETIDPKYRSLVQASELDLKNSLAATELARQQEEEVLRTNEGNAIRQAKAGLEKSGMTFSGKAVETLGGGSAYAQNPSDALATPTQTPFGGMFYEGTVNQSNRLMNTSASARYQQQLQQLGRQAENLLGTAGTAGLGLTYTPAGSQTGSIEDARNKELGATLSQIAENEAKKKALNTNTATSVTTLQTK